MRVFLVSLFLAGLVFSSIAQRRDPFIKVFQISLTPGMSSNGLHPGGFSNYFSINLTSGYSKANYLAELGLISNLNVHETRGLQFAGIANVTGANAFAGMREKEIDKTIREGFEANLSGGQFSGVANIVLNNVFGWQASGGINLSKGALMGFQLAGISNTVYKYAFGVQLAGLYNSAVESMDGVQVASLFNVTTGGLYGTQLSAFNKAGFMEGINSFPKTNDPTGVQIGLVNVAGKMNGFQIGLVNFGKRMQGTQIGLINIFGNGKDPQTHDGTTIGLLNLGSAFYLSGYVSDLFWSNVELASGTIKNRRVTGDRMERQVMNSLIYSNDARFLSDREQWAVGYGIQKMYFNRSTYPGMNRLWFISVGADVVHINHYRKKFTKTLSLLVRPEIVVGSRLHPKNQSFFFFVGGAYNVYVSNGETLPDNFIADGKKQWPGFSVGVMVQ